MGLSSADPYVAPLSAQVTPWGHHTQVPLHGTCTTPNQEGGGSHSHQPHNTHKHVTRTGSDPRWHSPASTSRQKAQHELRSQLMGKKQAFTLISIWSAKWVPEHGSLRMLGAKSEVCQAARIAGRYQECFHESQSLLPCDSVPPQRGVSSGEGRHVHKTGYKPGLSLVCLERLLCVLTRSVAQKGHSTAVAAPPTQALSELFRISSGKYIYIYKTFQNLSLQAQD